MHHFNALVRLQKYSKFYFISQWILYLSDTDPSFNVRCALTKYQICCQLSYFHSEKITVGRKVFSWHNKFQLKCSKKKIDQIPQQVMLSIKKNAIQSFSIRDFTFNQSSKSTRILYGKVDSTSYKIRVDFDLWCIAWRGLID